MASVFHEDGFFAAAFDANVALQINGIGEVVNARPDSERAAAETSKIIDAGLEGAIAIAIDLFIILSNGNGEWWDAHIDYPWRLENFSSRSAIKPRV